MLDHLLAIGPRALDPVIGVIGVKVLDVVGHVAGEHAGFAGALGAAEVARAVVVVHVAPHLGAVAEVLAAARAGEEVADDADLLLIGDGLLLEADEGRDLLQDDLVVGDLESDRKVSVEKVSKRESSLG